MKVGVLDYGVGNLGSVLGAFEHLRVDAILIDRPADMHACQSFVLPGVGNFADCMAVLQRDSWVTALQDEVLAAEKPLLGICLGMQMLATDSQEGALNNIAVPGLQFIPGHIRHLKDLGSTERIPHVGWNHIEICQNSSLLHRIPDYTDFYFVHSYGFVADSLERVVATTTYGAKVATVVNYKHIWGTQFHPEKSSRAGMQLLRNFVEAPVC